MNKAKNLHKIFIHCWISLILISGLTGQIVRTSDPALEGIDVISRLGDTIPLNLTFTDFTGEPVQLEDYFQAGKPVILTMTYTNCAMLCTMILDGLTTGLNQTDLVAGKDFTLVNVSIDTAETWETATARRNLYQNKLIHRTESTDWKYVVGNRAEIDQLAEAVGFQYYYDREHNQYAHPAVIFILTESGVISRYLFGITYSGRDLKLALTEARNAQVSSVFDKLLLYCFHYDGEAGGYVLMATNVMKLGGAATLVLLVIVLGIFWVREKRLVPNAGNRESQMSKLGGKE